MAHEGITCPVGHRTIWRKGRTPSRSGGKWRYVCVTCGRTFYPKASAPAKPPKRKRAKK